MKVYKFKCKDCGSTRYKKIGEDIYECTYCGYREEIINEETSAEKIEAEVRKQLEEERQSREQQLNEQFERDFADYEHHRKKLVKQIIVSLACFFFGMMGLHKFLECKIGRGILYLCTFGLFFIGYIFDIFKYSVNLAKTSSIVRQKQFEIYEKYGEEV